MISRRSFLTYLSAAVPVVAIAPSVLLEPKGGWLNDKWGAFPQNAMGLSRLTGLHPGLQYVVQTVQHGDTNIVTGDFRSAPFTELQI